MYFLEGITCLAKTALMYFSAVFFILVLGACKRFHQSATSAKLSSAPGFFGVRGSESHLISGCSLHQKQDLLAFGSII
jgi:hypothetical protein